MKFEDWLQHCKSDDIDYEIYWKSTYCDWGAYVVEIDIIEGFRNNMEIKEWINKNLVGQCDIFFKEVYFEFEEDAVMFALTWC